MNHYIIGWIESKLKLDFGYFLFQTNVKNSLLLVPLHPPNFSLLWTSNHFQENQKLSLRKFCVSPSQITRILFKPLSQFPLSPTQNGFLPEHVDPLANSEPQAVVQKPSG